MQRKRKCAIQFIAACSQALPALGIVWVIAPKALAADHTFNTGTNWNTPTNWLPSTVPAAGDGVLIGVTGSVPPSVLFDGNYDPSAPLSFVSIGPGANGLTPTQFTIASGSLATVWEQNSGTTVQTGGTNQTDFGYFTAYNLAGGTLSTLSVPAQLTSGISIGSLTQSGGLLNSLSSLTLNSANISGGAIVQSVNESLTTMNQSGGTHMVSGTLGMSNNSSYSLTGGLLSSEVLDAAGIFSVSAGQVLAQTLAVGFPYYVGGASTALVRQSGGQVSAGVVSVNSQSKYLLSGGVLQVGGGLGVNGTLDFGSGNSTLTVAAGGTLDLSQASILNAAHANVNIGPNTLTILPVGFNPSTAFGTFTDSGVVQTYGSALNIPSGQNIYLFNSQPGGVTVAGTLTGVGSQPFNFSSGLNVQAGGTVNLSQSDVAITQSIINMNGNFTSAGLSLGGGGSTHIIQNSGLLNATYIAVSSNVQWDLSGGTVSSSGSLTVNASSVQNLSGSGQINVAQGESLRGSVFNQTGGINSAGTVVSVDNGSVYSISSGTLTAAELVVGVAGDFTQTSAVAQTGGSVAISSGSAGSANSAGFLIVGAADDPSTFNGPQGVYIISAGSLSAQTILMGNGIYGGVVFNQSGGTVSAQNAYVGIRGPASLNQSGGSFSAGYLQVYSGSTYLLAGGSLQTSTGLTVAGTWNFASGSAVVNVLAGATVDLSAATILNASHATLNIGPNTLTILPTNFTPGSVFGAFSDQGVIQTAGDPLTVPMGQTISIGNDQYAPVSVMGTLNGLGNQTLGFYGGATVGGTAIANFPQNNIYLGDFDYPNDYKWSISGGALVAAAINLGFYTNFVQSGGSVNAAIVLEDSSSYQLTGGSLNASYIQLTGNGGDSDNPASYFQQSGGSCVATTLLIQPSDTSPIVNSFLLGGSGILQLQSETVGTQSRTLGLCMFLQSSGTQTIGNSLTVGNGGTFDMAGGSLTASSLILSVPISTSKTTTPTLTQTGGTISLVPDRFSDGSLAIAYNVSGNNYVPTRLPPATFNMKGGLFSASNIYDGVTSNGAVNQSGGSVVVRGFITIGANGAYILRGGTLSASQVQNSGLFNIAAGAFTGSLSNFGTTNISANTSFNGILNNGQIDISGANVTCTSALTSQGNIVLSKSGVLLGGSIACASLVLGSSCAVSGNSISIVGGSISLGTGASVTGNLVTIDNSIATMQGPGGRIIAGTAGLVISNGGSVVLSSDAVNPGQLLLHGDVRVTQSDSAESITTSTVGLGQIAGFIDLGGTSRQFNVAPGSAGVQLIVAAPLTDGTLVKAGDGTMSLSSFSSNFSGGVVVTGGTLQIAAASPFSGGLFMLSAGPSIGTLSVDSDAELGAASNNLNLSGGTFLATSSFSTNRLVTLGQSGNGVGTFNVSSGMNLALNGAINGSTSLNKTGAGTLTLNGSLSYQGSTGVMAGTVVLGPGVVLPAQSVINIAPGATFDLGNQPRTMAALQDALMPDKSRAGGTVALGGSVLTVGTLGASTIFSGNINGSSGGAIVMAGSSASSLMVLGGPLTNFTGGVSVTGGTLLLSCSANTFSGGLTANGGALEVTSEASMGNAGNGIALSAGGTFETASSFSTARTISATGSGGTIAVAVGNILVDSGNIVGTSPLTISGTTLIPGLATGSGTLNLTSAISFSGAMTIDGSASPSGFSSVTLLLNGGGTIKSVSSLTLLRQGTLAVYDGSGITSGRLGSATAMNLSGGTLSIMGPSSATATESLGSLMVSGGNSSINLIDGNGTAAAVDLTFSSLNLFTGATLSLNLSSSSDRIFFTTPPAVSAHGFIAGLSLIDAGVTSLHVQYSSTLGIVPYGTAGAGVLPGGGSGESSVPEPGGLGLASGIVGGLLRRRKRFLAVGCSDCFCQRVFRTAADWKGDILR